MIFINIVGTFLVLWLIILFNNLQSDRIKLSVDIDKLEEANNDADDLVYYNR